MSIKAVAFDLDGTIYFGNQPAEGALETVNFLKTQGLSIFYLTNNSTSTRLTLLKKLTGMGFNLNVEDIYSSAFVAANYLKNKRISNVYCLGSEGLIHELNHMGINVVTHEHAQALIIGLDSAISYEKMATALNLVIHNVPVIVCNKDRNYPVENNELRPGCGSLVAAIEFASEKIFDCMIGKPNTYMMDLLLKENKLSYKEVLVVGDSSETDIAMAEKTGCPSVLISQANTFSSTKVLNDIAEIKSHWNILKKIQGAS